MAAALNSPRVQTPIPAAFKSAFQEQPGYTEPHVIMEYLATDYPEPLTTLFYTSLYSQINNVKPTSEKIVLFSKELSLTDIIAAFQHILRSANLQHVIKPETIDDKTQIVTVEYKPIYSLGSDGFKQIFLPLLYGALGLLVETYHGVEVSK